MLTLALKLICILFANIVFTFDSHVYQGFEQLCHGFRDWPISGIDQPAKSVVYFKSGQKVTRR